MVEDRDPRGDAIRRLRAKRAVRAHAITYVGVNVFLVGVWAVSSRGYFWPVWTILGWGFGLAAHAWSVYGNRGITEAEIEREMGKGGTTVT